MPGGLLNNPHLIGCKTVIEKQINYMKILLKLSVQKNALL